MRNEMLTPGFVWYYFKHNFIKSVLVLGLTFAFVCAPILYSPQKAKIKTMRTYKDGSVFIRTGDQWLTVDNDKVKVKGKEAFFVNKNLIIGTRILFILFNLTFISISMKSGRLRKLWWEYNSSKIKVVRDSLNRDEYQILNNRIIRKNGMESPSYTEYPKLYDRIEIRMNTIKNIIK